MEHEVREGANIRKLMDHYNNRLACKITLFDATNTALFEFGYVTLDPQFQQSYETDDLGVTVHIQDQESRIMSTTRYTYNRIILRVLEHKTQDMISPEGTKVKAAGRYGSSTLDSDMDRQKHNLEAIFRDASCSPYFHRNEKYCIGEYKNRLPFISYSDVMSNRYIIRSAPVGFTPQSFYNEEDPVLVEYSSIDELVNDGWRLD